MIKVRLIRWDRSLSSAFNPTGGQEIFELDCTTGACVDRYTPQTAERETRDDVVNYTDGGEIEYSAWRNVTDVIDLTFDSDRAAYHEVQRIIEDAVFAQRDRRSQSVFIAYMSAVDNQWWYSEILSGRLVANTETTADTDEGIGKFGARLEILRRFYWENDPYFLTMSRNGGPSGTSALIGSSGSPTIIGNAENYIDILAKDIEGVLPAPVTLYVDPFPTLPGLQIYDTRWGLSRSIRPFLFQHHYTIISPPVAIPSTEVLAYAITITTSTTNNGGGWYQVMACVNGALTGLIPLNGQFRAEIIEPLSGEVICSSATVERERPEGVFSVGLLKIPPRQMQNAGPLLLRIYARYPSQLGFGSLNISAIQLLPTDSFRLWRVDYDPVAGTQIVDNMIDDAHYVQNPLALGFNLLWPEYGKIFLWPRRDQRLIAIPEILGGGWDESAEFELKIEYRQRRLNV